MLRGSIAASLILLGFAAVAQDVTLTSRDGGVAVTGTLLDFDGEVYRVDTAFGQLTLDGTGVDCKGEACPDASAFVAELDIAGPDALMSRLLPELLAGFAASEGFILEKQGATYLLRDRETGRDAARFSMSSQSDADAVFGLNEKSRGLALTRGMPEWDRTGSADGRTHHVVALDAIAPMVDGSNPIDGVTAKEFGEILSGEITEWSAVGGDEMPIVLTAPPAGSVEYEILQASGISSAISGTGDAVQKTSDTDPFALALRPISDARTARALEIRGPCGIALVPDDASLKTELYPLTMPVYLTHSGRRLPRIARDFIAFARSDAVHPLVRSAGYVDQSIERIPFSAQGARLATVILTGADAAGLAEVQRMVSDLSEFDRLTMSFRFRDGSIRLDAHSASNVRVLADALDQGVFDDHDVIIAGFSDGVGDAGSNLRLSRQRSRAVRDLLLLEVTPPADRWRDPLVAKGYGEAAPIACDEVEWGRQLNRRVEIWVRQR